MRGSGKRTRGLRSKVKGKGETTARGREDCEKESSLSRERFNKGTDLLRTSHSTSAGLIGFLKASVRGHL